MARISAAARKAAELPSTNSEEYETAIRSVKGLRDQEYQFLLALNPHRHKSLSLFLIGIHALTDSDDRNVARLAKGMYFSCLAGIVSSHGPKSQTACNLIVQDSPQPPLSEFAANLDTLDLHPDERALLAACHPESKDLELRLQVLKESEVPTVAVAAADLFSILSER